ncbi:MAG: ABC transporter ATP-binding protein [Clostridia bacterium]|nr:ABC transporter ATP-binding protein [Clostridia bacterium]
MKKEKTKEKKEKFETLKNVLFAVKILRECAPWYLTARIASMFGYWFFTGFVQEIWFLKSILQIIEDGGTFKEFVTVVVIFALAGVLGKALHNGFDYIISSKVKIFYKNLNKKIFDKAVNVDMACFENPDFFDKYKRATEIITDDHYDWFGYYFAVLFAGGITGVFIIWYVVSIDPGILLILLFALPVVAVQALKGKIEVKKDKEMTLHKRSKAYVKRIIYLKEYSKDMRTSSIFDVLHTRYANAVEHNREIIKKYGYKIAFLESMTGFFGQALPVAVAYAYATYRYAIKKNLALANFSVIMTAMSNLRDVVNDLGNALSTIKKESLYFGNLREFLSYESAVVGGSKEAEELETLEFKNVTFTYPGSEKETLKNLNLVFNRGETTAIVGQNGAGKTTFVKLLLRFYDPQEGVILYNGVDLREYDLQSLRSRLATVFQDYKVFALSVAENVLCKEIEGESDRSNVLDALKNSGADGIVDSLPQKENTVLTREFDETGVGLSGGEQQKIATARMFAKDFDLAILDEPSSALDPIAEYKMYEKLLEATKDKTVIYISHRLSSAVLSDKIYVFGDGTVQESGAHDELINKNGIYAEMFTLQASNYKNDEGSVNEI